jgi:TfoX/Sxy family transcriptional regulator of competence genes
MAYDRDLADRVEELLADHVGVARRRMFGGLAWLLNGNLAVAVRSGGGLMIRVDPVEHDELLAEPGAATMMMRGRPLRGWITVAASGTATPADLTRWVRHGTAYAATLPVK